MLTSFLEFLAAAWSLLAPHKGLVAWLIAALAALALALLAIHLPEASLRVYPVYGLAVLSFFTGFFLPRPSFLP